jgi:hypothetical protein
MPDQALEVWQVLWQVLPRVADPRRSCYVSSIVFQHLV